MCTNTVHDVRHIPPTRPHYTDMLSILTETDTMVFNTYWVVLLLVNVDVLGDHQQLGLVVAEGDPVLPTVVLGEKEDVTKAC